MFFFSSGLSGSVFLHVLDLWEYGSVIKYFCICRLLSVICCLSTRATKGEFQSKYSINPSRFLHARFPGERQCNAANHFFGIFILMVFMPFLDFEKWQIYVCLHKICYVDQMYRPIRIKFCIQLPSGDSY